MSTSLNTTKTETALESQRPFRCYCTFKNDQNHRNEENKLTKSSRCYSSPDLVQALQRDSNHSSTPPRTPSSTSDTSTEIIRNISDVPPVEAFTTSAVLHYCKRKILVPYQRFLSLLGWRTFTLEDTSCCSRFGVGLYGVLVVIFVILGYVLQYAACFRRDLVDSYRLYVSDVDAEMHEKIVCKGSAFGLYFLPDFLHFSAYCYTYYLLRVCESEQLQILMERVFLQAFYSRSNYITQPKLVQRLRIFLGLSLGWIALSILVQVLHAVADYPVFTWIQPGEVGEMILIALLVLSLIWDDVIHVTIIMSYSIQCQLLNSFIRGLCERVREKSISLQEAVKEIGESAKMLKHLNEEFSISVTLMMLHSGVLSVSGIIWSFTITKLTSKNAIVLATNFLSVVLWISIFTFPLIQAARLSAACHCLKKLGQFLLTRPFGYTDASQQQLDSFLLYTSSLDLQAKLFRIPVRPAVLLGSVVAFCFLFLLFAQLDIIKVGF